MPETRITHLLPHQLRERRNECPVAWIPLGTLEWHGRHLPLGVDGLIVEGLCLWAASEIGGVVFPALYYGDHRGITVEAVADPEVWPAKGVLSFDHREVCCSELGVSLAGVTANAVRDDERIGADSEAYVELVERSLWMARAYGFSRIVLAPGHGGTIGPAQHATERFNAKQSACIAVSGVEAYLGDEAGGHAGGFETGAMLHFHEDLVELDQLAHDKPDEPVGVDYRNEKHPGLATAADGRAIADGFIARIRDTLKDIPGTVFLEDPDEDGCTGDWIERLTSQGLFDAESAQ